MKKGMMITAGVAILLSSCGTYTGSGAYMGGTLGSILGSAIGGISDGPRGSDVGSIVGMAGGAIIGAAVGSAADKKAEERLARIEQRRTEDRRTRSYEDDTYSHSRYDEVEVDETNGGDDRLFDFTGADYTGDYSAKQPTEARSAGDWKMSATVFPVEIVNARLVDENKDKMINGGELCKIIFEVANVSRETLYDVQPIVTETSGLKKISISPTIHIEQLQPGKKIRYTALLHAGKGIKNATARITLTVVQGNNKTISKVTEFNVPTRK